MDGRPVAVRRSTFGSNLPGLGALVPHSAVEGIINLYGIHHFWNMKAVFCFSIYALRYKTKRRHHIRSYISMSNRVLTR